MGNLAQKLADAKRAGWAKWIQSEADERAVAEGCWFDERAARRVDKFFSGLLKHSKGRWANKPFELLPWQRDQVIYPLFGWKWSNGKRRYRKSGIWIPKKNGKSTLAAGVSLYMLAGDGEPGAEVYNAAVDRDQAAIVFAEAMSMVRKSPALSAMLSINASKKRIAYTADDGSMSWYDAISSDESNEGLNPHAVVVDELHAHKNRKLFDLINYGGAARDQPLMLTISTAGYDRQSVGFEQFQYAKDVADGRIFDLRFFAYIAAAGDEDNWTDEKTWHKANPSLGQTISLESFRADAVEAQNSPPKQNAFKRYRLNIWTSQVTRWIAMNLWDQCRRDYTAEQLVGQECFGAFDLSLRRDLTSFTALFPQPDGSYRQLSHSWLPEEGIEAKEVEDHCPYRTWASMGLLSLTNNGTGTIDYTVVEEWIAAFSKRHRLRVVAYDQYNAHYLALALRDKHRVEVVDQSQRIAVMSQPTKEYGELVTARKMHHNGDPLLRQCFENVAIISDSNGNIKPSKDPKHSRGRVDPIVCAIMALAASKAQGLPGGRSIYSERGIMVVS